MNDSGWGDTAARSLLWITLGGWIGAWIFFSLGVSVVAFRALPSAELAGQVVGPLLGFLHLYGAAAGALLAVLALVMGRGPWLAGLPILLAALCIYSELGITEEIAAIRPQAFGENATIEATERFGVLHRRSIGVFAVVGLGAIGLAVAHARRDTVSARGQSAAASVVPPAAA